jgi:hypothetical protein
MEEEDWKCHQRIEVSAYAYHLHSTAFQCIVNVEKNLKEDTPELISGSQLFNSSIHSFITEEEEDGGVSAHVTAYKFAQALATVFVIIIAVDNLQKLGTKKCDYLTLMMTQSLFVSFVSFSSLSHSLSHPQEVKLCSLIVSLQNLSFYCPIGGSFFKSLEKQQLLRPLYGKKPKKISQGMWIMANTVPFSCLIVCPFYIHWKKCAGTLWYENISI